MSLSSRIMACGAWAVLGLAACADQGDHHDAVPMDDSVAVARSAVSLPDLNAGCSTAGTEGISAQLIDEMLCMTDGQLLEYSHPSIVLTSSRVHPYLTAESRDALLRAADRTTIEINSGLRTIAEQYVLWLGCSVAATPGTSNHETGRALDVNNYGAAGGALVDEGFSHPLPGSDPVHFEGPGVDLRSTSVLAFQRLWNVNHPEDRIDEDGVSGPQTLGRLERTPAEGFPIDHVCEEGPPPLQAEFVGQGSDAPADATGAAHFVVCGGQPIRFWFDLRNTGGAAWLDDGSTGAEDWGRAVRLGVPTDTPDPLAGTSRVSVVASSNGGVQPGGGDCTAPGCARAVFSMDGMAPTSPGVVRTVWRLVDEGRAWFGPEVWLDVRVEDCPDPEPDPEPDAGLDAGPDGDVELDADVEADSSGDAEADAVGPRPQDDPVRGVRGGCSAALTARPLPGIHALLGL